MFSASGAMRMLHSSRRPEEPDGCCTPKPGVRKTGSDEPYWFRGEILRASVVPCLVSGPELAREFETSRKPCAHASRAVAM